MDAVNTPTYDWGMGAATSIRMAARITGRSAALVAATVSPDRLSCMKNYAFSAVPTFVAVAIDPQTGLIDLEDLRAKMTDDIAVFYFENPSFLGVIEHQGVQIAQIVHDKGGLVVAGVDPISLGVLQAPARYGVDIACGDVQGLGIPMSCGGGQGGFVATQDEPKFFQEFPALMYGLTPTIVEGEYGFGEVFFERTSYASREKAKDFLGTMAQLHGIGAGVYLSLMGPQGMRELGEGIMQRSAYLARELAEIRVSGTALLGAVLQGVRCQLRWHRQDRRHDQQGSARAPDLRRLGSLQVVPELGPKRSLLRHRGPHQR